MRPINQTTGNLTNRDTLSANRQGELTPAQRERLTQLAYARRGCLTRALKILAFPAAGLGLVLVLGFVNAPLVLGWLALLIVLAVTVDLVLIIVPAFLQQRIRLRQDLEHETLATAEGTLVYGKRGYEVRTAGQTLTLPSQGSGLVPGIAYRFYFLPRSTYILSAEPLGQESTARAREGLQQALARALRFDVTHLASNREGFLAPGQIVLLLPRLMLGALLAAIPGAGLLLLAWQIITNGAVIAIVGSVIMGAAGAFCLIAGFRIAATALLDIMSSRVEAVEGAAYKGKQRDEHAPFGLAIFYEYRIGEQRVKVPERAYAALLDGLPYRLYYTRRSNIIVAIEPLAAPPITMQAETHSSKEDCNVKNESRIE